MAPEGKLKANAVTSATYDTVLQVSLRVSSFILNAFIVRRVSSTVFGLLNVRLYLLYSTGLLLSREAFRRAALGCQVGQRDGKEGGQTGNKKQESTRYIPKLVNLIWIGSLLSIPLSFAGFVIWHYGMAPPPVEVLDQYSCGLALIIGSVVVEVMAESPYILAELQLWTKMRVLIEGMAQVIRSAILAFGIYYWPEKPVIVYGIAYITGSIVLCVSYYYTFLSSIWKKRKKKKKGEEEENLNEEKVLLIPDFRSLFPTIPKGHMLPDVDKTLSGVAWTFFKQGWLKEALTEGELYLMTFFPLITLAQQGTYQVVNNLGSLAARLVFRSVEAASYKYFAQMLARGVPARYQAKGVAKEVSTVLRDLLLQLCLISLIIVSFGWSFSALVLQLYGGSNLRDEGRGLLRFQCLYVVLLALNGVTESFAFAVQNQKQLDRYNRYLIVFSFVYVCTALVSVLGCGAYGYVLANCVNMALRIIYNMHFIRSHFEGTSFDPLEALRLRCGVVVAYFFVFIIMVASEVLCGPILHIFNGSILLIVLVFYLRYELSGIIVIVLGIIDNIFYKIFKFGNRTEREKGELKKYKLGILNYIYHVLYSKKVR